MWHLQRRIRKIIRSPWNWKSGSSNLNGNGNSSRSTDSYGCVVTGGKYDAENERLTQALKNSYRTSVSV